MIKFGLSVTGTVSPDAIWTNAGAKVGDVLILTKPLGIGVILSAIALTGIYVLRANGEFDDLTRRIVDDARCAGAAPPWQASRRCSPSLAVR